MQHPCITLEPSSCPSCLPHAPNAVFSNSPPSASPASSPACSPAATATRHLRHHATTPSRRPLHDPASPSREHRSDPDPRPPAPPRFPQAPVGSVHTVSQRGRERSQPLLSDCGSISRRLNNTTNSTTQTSGSPRSTGCRFFLSPQARTAVAEKASPTPFFPST